MKKFLLWQHHKKVSSHNVGFTLSEIVWTLSLVQLIIALSVPFIFWSKRITVFHEMQRLYATLQYAQRKALIERKPCTLVFYPERGSYALDHEHVMDASVIFGIQPGLCGPPSAASHQITDAITWPHKKIVFYPLDHAKNSAGTSTLGTNTLGTSALGASTSGTVYMTDTARSCCYALTCDASYGSILRRYRYKGKWELLS